jgi:hypothetical protein
MQSTLNVASIVAFSNLARTQAGLPALQPNDLLMQAANNKARDMLRLGYWSHYTLSNTPPWYFLDQVHYPYTFAGENLARDYTTSEQVVNAWLASPTHKANLLNPVYQDVGIAIVDGQYPTGKTTHLVVQLLGSQSLTRQATTPYQTTDFLVATSTPIQPSIWFYFFISLIVFLIAFLFFKFGKPHRSRPSPPHRLKRPPSSLWTH